jgi:hypothetical protein
MKKKSGVEYLAQHPGWKTHGQKHAARKKRKSVVEHLDASDVATILAALRMFQEAYEDYDATSIAEDWPNHFEVQSPGGEVGGQDVSDELIVVPQPLGSEDIDALCERINCARKLVLK